MIKRDNITETRNNMYKLAQKKPEAFARGLMAAGLTLQAEAQRLVPVDTGALKSSAYTKLNGQVQTPADSSSIFGAIRSIAAQAARGLLGKIPGFAPRPEIDVEVGFTQAYAIYVHEDLKANHPNGGQAKFLEEPARRMRGDLTDIVIQEVKNG